MIELEAKVWRRRALVCSLFTIPVAVFAVTNLKADTAIAFYWWLMLTIWLFILTLGSLERKGVIRVLYSEKERKSWLFRMKVKCAQREKARWGGKFSAVYYETYLGGDIEWK